MSPPHHLITSPSPHHLANRSAAELPWRLHHVGRHALPSEAAAGTGPKPQTHGRSALLVTAVALAAVALPWVGRYWPTGAPPLVAGLLR
jgi:hypothetical protein